MLHLKWKEYVALYGTTEDRVDLLNRSAPAFFVMLHDSMWESVLLHICRLTDRPEVAGKATLTISRLPRLVREEHRTDIEQLLTVVAEKTSFARDWRNRHIAHRDLGLALRTDVRPLDDASRLSVNEALQTITAVLNAVEQRYCDSAPIPYDFIDSAPGGAVQLLYVLRDALDAREDKMQRFERGELLPEDHQRKPPL